MNNEHLQMITANNKGKGKCIYIDSVTCNYTNACLYLVSIHQMAPPQTEVAYT